MAKSFTIKIRGIGNLTSLGRKDIMVTKFTKHETLADSIAAAFEMGSISDMRMYVSDTPHEDSTMPDDEDGNGSDLQPHVNAGAAIVLDDVIESTKEYLSSAADGENDVSLLVFGDSSYVDSCSRMPGKRSKQSSRRSSGTIHSDEDDSEVEPKKAGPGRRETQPWHLDALERIQDLLFRLVMPLVEHSSIETYNMCDCMHGKGWTVHAKR